MVDYLYTNTLTIKSHTSPQAEKVQKVQKCDQHGSEHSCTNQACRLWPCGFAIAMYALGDKYNIPGLRIGALEYLQIAYDLCVTDSWAEDIKIFELAYQQSRCSDDLRSWLTAQIYRGFTLGLTCHLHEYPGFYPFIERSPELTAPLLKYTLLNSLSGRQHSMT